MIAQPMSANTRTKLAVLSSPSIRYGVILFFYSLLTVVMTYPLILTATSRLPGSIDIFGSIWALWYPGFMLTHSTSLPSAFYTDYLFYPQGSPLTIFYTAYNQLIAMALVPILGMVLTCNILYLSSFILSGFGAYLLVKHIVHDEAAALIAGAIFTFAPYHFEHAFVGHLGSLTMQWIPFCGLFLIRMFEGKKLSDAVMASIFFVLVAMSDQQYCVFMGVFAGLFVLYQFIVVRRSMPDRKELILLSVFAMISLLFVVPLNYGNITAATSGDNYLDPGKNAARFGSVDLLNFIVPSAHHPIFGNLVQKFYDSMDMTIIPWEKVAFTGVTVLFLIAYGAVRERSKTLLFWEISAIFFALMSLGPILQVAGHMVFLGREIPLPYSILSQIIPGLSNSRTPGRFEVLTLLSISVLAGIGASRLRKDLSSLRTDKLKSQVLQVLAPMLIMMLILFEFLSVPFLTTDPQVPEFFYALAQEQGDFAILEIPATTNYTAGITAEYYQTVHHKKIVGGQLARAPDSSTEFEKKTPFIAEITYPGSAGDLFKQNVTLIARSVLSSYDIKYVIIHKGYPESTALIQENGMAHSAFGSPIYSDDELVAYKVDKPGEVQPYVMLDKNWHTVESWSGVPACWMSNNATVKLTPGNSTGIWLNFTGYSYGELRTLYVLDGNKTVLDCTIATNGTPVSLWISLTDQTSKSLLFYTPDSPVRPIDILSLNSTDERLISIAITNCSAEFVSKQT